MDLLDLVLSWHATVGVLDRRACVSIEDQPRYELEIADTNKYAVAIQDESC